MTRPSRAAYTTNLKAKWHREELLPSHRHIDTSGRNMVIRDTGSHVH